MELWESIATLAGTKNINTNFVFYAEIKSVNESNRQCTVNATTLQSTDITMTVDLCLLGNTGLVVIPSIGSTVLVMYSKTVNPCIIQHSYIDKLLLNGDNNGGVPISSNLVTRLNNIENLLNDLIGKYNIHTHASNGVTTTSLEPNTVTPTQSSDIASTTIFQG